ncbi:MAG: MFS transporter [Rhodobacteraceae bacterium]|nr:MFS transporter [Paracoccaceae bacterium]
MLTPWLLLSFTFLIGCGTALHNPSWQASVGDIVSRAELSAAVSVNSMGFNLMRSVGPAAGGAIVAIAGAAAAFAVNALSYVAIIAALFNWRPALPPRRLPARTLRQRVFGRAALCRDVAQSSARVLRGFLFGCSAVALQALLPLVVRDHLQGTAMVYGVLLGCFGFGAVAGAIGNARLRARFHNERITKLGFLGCGERRRPVAERRFSDKRRRDVRGGHLLGGVLVASSVTMRLSTPRWVVGRVLALYQTGVFGGMAGGSWLWGAVAERAGLQGALLGAAAVLVLGALAGLIAPLPDTGELNLDPLNRFGNRPCSLT